MANTRSSRPRPPQSKSSQPKPTKPKSRSPGMALMGLAMLVFIGINADMLPAVTFWPALAVFVGGAVSFMQGNRVATAISEERTRKALNPELKNLAGVRFAAQQAQMNGAALADLDDRALRSTASAQIRDGQQDDEEIVLYEVDSEQASTGSSGFVVTTDVSFPVEVQERRSIAEQLEKLQRLKAQGVITAEEFSIAKAKLFS